MELEAIYREHFAFVWAVLRRLGVGDHDLEDVAQDVFVVVHRRLQEFEGRAAIRTWLYAIAVRVAWNHLRRRKIREPAADTSATSLVAPATAGDPEEHTVRTQAGQLLDTLLGRLDDDKRAVFVLSEIEGLTAPQIAEIVGANPRTVYSRLRAARDRVQADLVRIQAREQSAGERRGWLRRAAADDHPPARAEGRVWAALLVQLPSVGATKIAASGAGVGAAIVWSGWAQAVTVSVALGAAGLGTLWVAATPMRESQSSTSASRGSDDRAAVAASISPAGSAGARSSPARASRLEDAVAPIIATPATSANARARSAGGREHESPATSRSNAAASSSTRDAPDTGTADPEPHDPLTQELPLLERARVALAAHDAAAALDALDDHLRRFPEGALARDRERSRVQALCALGRAQEAARVADANGIPGCADTDVPDHP